MSAEPPALSWPSTPAVKTPLPLPWPVPTDERATAGVVLGFATNRQDVGAAAVAASPHCERATAGAAPPGVVGTAPSAGIGAAALADRRRR